MKKIFFLAASLCIYLHAQAQTSDLFYYNKMRYNPAMTAFDDSSSVLIQMGKSIDNYSSITPQWGYAGFEKTLPGKAGALGALVSGNRLGYQDIYNAKLNYTYRLTLAEDIFIGAGAGAGIQQIRFNYNKLKPQPLYPPNMPKGILSDTRAQLDLGFCLRLRSAWAGVGFNNVLPGTYHFEGVSVKSATTSYLTMGIDFGNRKKIMITPAFFMSREKDSPNYFKATLNCSIYNRAFIGFNVDEYAILGFNAGVRLGKLQLLVSCKPRQTKINFGPESNLSPAIEYMLRYRF